MEQHNFVFIYDFLGITVHLVGKAKVSYMKVEKRGSDRKVKNYKAEEIYLNQTINVYGSGNLFTLKISSKGSDSFD